jgi:hypothetical protein
MTVGRWVAYGYVAHAMTFLMLGTSFDLHAVVLVLAIYCCPRLGHAHSLMLWPMDFGPE